MDTGTGDDPEDCSIPPVDHAFIPPIDFTNVEVFPFRKRRAAFSTATTKWAAHDRNNTVVPLRRPEKAETSAEPYIEDMEPKRSVRAAAGNDPVASREQNARFISAMVDVLKARPGRSISTTKLIKRVRATAPAGSGTFPTTPQSRALLNRGAAAGERPLSSVDIPEVRCFTREDGAMAWVWDTDVGGQENAPQQGEPLRGEEAVSIPVPNPSEPCQENPSG